MSGNPKRSSDIRLTETDVGKVDNQSASRAASSWARRLLSKTGLWGTLRSGVSSKLEEDFSVFQSKVTQMMLNINEPVIRLPGVTVTVDQDLSYAYTGAITGTTTLVSPTYYTVELWCHTDIGYLIGTSSLNVQGEFSFPSSAPGGKQLRFIRTSDSAWVDTYEKTVATRSYRMPTSVEPALYTALVDRCFTYDQAVATCALVAQGHSLSHDYAAGLAAIVGNAGQIAFSVNRFSAIAPDPYYRTGASAWVAYGLAFYLKKYPTGPSAAECQAKLTLALSWLESYLVTNPIDNRYGLYRGGSGLYASGYGSFDPNFQIQWVALEHQVDLWFLFDLCAQLGIGTYASKRDALAAKMLEKFWIDVQGRLTQGINETSTDYAAALDQSSWGGLWLLAIGDSAKASLAYAYLDKFAFNSALAIGYSPYHPDYGYPTTVRGVWSEGTAGVALLERALGKETSAAQTVTGAANLKDARYGYKYVSDLDLSNELQPWESVAGNGWMLLANNPNGFWNVSNGNFALGKVRI